MLNKQFLKKTMPHKLNQENVPQEAKVSKKRMKRRWKYPLIFFGILFSLYVIAVIVYNVDESNKKQAAAARLLADPISTGGIYNALNKERAATGAPALATVQNLQTGAEQYCADMTASHYSDYKNPATGKEANSFIADNLGDLYFKTYVASMMIGNPATQTSKDVIAENAKNQAENINNPVFNSIGTAVCADPTDPNITRIAMLIADKEEKPVSPPRPQVNNYYQSPTYTAPRSTFCSSYEIGATVNTYCH